METYRNLRKAAAARGGKPRSDASVNREMALLSHMFNKAVEWGMLQISPFKKGKRLMFKENNHWLRFLADTEVEALLKACSPHLRPIYVFCDSQGRRFYEVKRSFASTCQRAGLEDFRFHDLRHTFASHLVMKGAGLKALQELLGHADIKMTLRYSHLSQAHLKEAVAVPDNLGVDTNLTQKALPKTKG